MDAILLFGLFFLLLLLRVPIAFSLIISSTVLLYLNGFDISMIPQRMFSGVDKSTLIAIPAFVFAGVLMAKGGISKYLIESIKSWIGHYSGGMAIVTIVACMIFASISGSSAATVAAIGIIMIPALIESGYSQRYAIGLVAVSGTLGILIPPSIPLILYGVVAEESIGQLFIAAVVPGIILGLLLIITAYVYAKVKGFKVEEKASFSERMSRLRKGVWAYLMPIIILGTIYTGVASPTEAAVISMLYAIIITFFVYKEISIKDLKGIMRQTISISSMLYIIISAAMVFSLYLTNARIPQIMTEFITGSDTNYWMVLLLINLLFFVLGMFLDVVAVILITLPILLPVIASIGINPIHFAIIMIINMEIAQVTPPLGMNLFVVKSLTKTKLIEVVRSVLPFIILLIIALIIIIVFPSISLFLPELMFK